MWIYWRLFLIALRLTGRQRRDLVLENLVLRQQLAVWERTARRPALVSADRRFWSATARHWAGWRTHVRVVKPATVVRWHRTAWRRYWTWKSRRRRPGRARVPVETRALIIRFAEENPTWGVRRIADELAVLGISVSAATVHRYRPPRPSPSPSWRTFLRTHAADIWAVDFFTVQTLTFRTLYVVLFVSHGRRRIEHWNVTAHPTADWVWHQVLAATPWGRQPRYLIRDRDARFGATFNDRLGAIGIQSIVTPYRAPQANAVVERLVGTLRRECFDHVIALSERHVRRVMREYVPYYSAVRPHQSLAGQPPVGPRPQSPRSGQIVARPILGGLHHEYRWAAA